MALTDINSPQYALQARDFYNPPSHAHSMHGVGGYTRLDDAMRTVTSGLQALVQAMVVEQTRSLQAKSSDDLSAMWERIEQLETELDELQS